MGWVGGHRAAIDALAGQRRPDEAGEAVVAEPADPADPQAKPGEADGDALPATASLKDALDALLWSGRRSLPLSDAAGRPAGRVTLEAILGRGDGRP